MPVVEFGKGDGLTPVVVKGSSRGFDAWNSPWLATASGLRDAMLYS